MTLNKDMDIELEWLIKEYSPRLLEKARGLVTTSLNACLPHVPLNDSKSSSPKGVGGGGSVRFPPATLVLSTVGTDILKGYVCLDGHSIGKVEAQVNFGPSWNHHRGPQPIQLAPGHQIVLDQIVQVADHLRIALDALSKLQLPIRVYSGKDGEPLELHENYSYPSAPYITSCLRRALSSTATVINLLTTPDPNLHTFPAGHFDPSAFRNNLPDNLYIHFYIQNARLIATIHACSPSPAAGAARSATTALPSIVGAEDLTVPVGLEQACPAGDLGMTVLYQTRVEAAVPAYTAAMSMAKEAYADLYGLLGNFETILSLYE